MSAEDTQSEVVENGDEQETEVEETEVQESEESTEAEETEAEEETEDEEQPAASEEPEAKATRSVHEHKPTPAYVEMVVRKREERGDLSAKELKEYRLAMLRKHGLPTNQREMKAYEKAQAEAKAARKALAKEQRRAARAARKAELAASSTQ